MKTIEPIFLVVDLFCGAGGTTTGFAQAELEGNGIAKVIACVNHDPKAIQSHWQNHPEVKHFEEDIRILDLTELTAITKHWQAIYPNAYLILWASLECTNFSKAKGGQPRDADSRTLADHLDRYITALNPDYIQIENVVEFMSWGPLDEKGKPISRKSGADWLRWREHIRSFGYRDEWRELNSADFGAYTSRNRLFGCFAKPDCAIVWPEPTHSKKATSGMFGAMEKWKPVKDVLDFKDEGKSIFNRKKPLSDKTLERIYAGLLKYVAKGDTSFISKYFSGRPKGKVNSINDPAPTVTTFGGNALVNAKYHAADLPIDGPAVTITTKDHHALVNTQFLAAYYGNGDNVSSVDSPCPTVPTKDRFGIINPEYFIDKHYGASQNQSIENPAGTLMPNDKHRLVECTPFMMPTNFDNKPRSIEEPAPTITADRHATYIVNPSHGGHCTSSDAPCPVIVARQDKAPLSVVMVEGGKVAVEIYDTDTEPMKKIKHFMAMYQLVDIKMRMLRVNELKKIQGFPENYVLAGTQSDQKKFIGNSVVPDVVKAWIEAIGMRTIENQKSKRA
jgi:DNA (cytosine-5)-methyltransferase 1